MTGLDIFVISFGVAFIVASDRFKRGIDVLARSVLPARRR